MGRRSRASADFDAGTEIRSATNQIELNRSQKKVERIRTKEEERRYGKKVKGDKSEVKKEEGWYAAPPKTQGVWASESSIVPPSTSAAIWADMTKIQSPSVSKPTEDDFQVECGVCSKLYFWSQLADGDGVCSSCLQRVCVDC